MAEDSMQNGDLQRFRWFGNDALYLDNPHIVACGTVVIGCYGGRLILPQKSIYCVLV
jgi:hypothetical protein